MQLSDIAIGPGERAAFVGKTRSGKTTLAEFLLDDELTRTANLETLIIDPKPRFRAQFDVHGQSPERLYKAFRNEKIFPYSVLIKPGDYDLRRAFRVARELTPKNRGTCVIASALGSYPRAAYGWQVELIHLNYGMASKKKWRRLYLDEAVLLLGNSRRMAESTITTVVAGGEKGVGAACAFQRPKGIPLLLLTEMTKLYLFYTGFTDDLKRLYEMGFPRDAEEPDQLHEFTYFDAVSGTTKRLKLNLGEKQHEPARP